MLSLHRLINLESGALSPELHLAEGQSEGGFVGQMTVGGQPADASPPQPTRSGCDEGRTEGAILAPPFMEGGIHDDKVEVASGPIGPAQVSVMKTGPGISDITPGALDGTAVDVPQFDGLDAGRLEHMKGENTESAPKIRAPPLQGRDGFQKQGCAGIQAIPAEDAGLGPEAKLLIEPGTTGLKGLVQARGTKWPDGAANPVTPPRVIRDHTSKRPQGRGDARSAAIIRRKGEEFSAGRKQLEGPGQNPIALQTARRRQDQGRGEHAGGGLGQVDPAGFHRRSLDGALRVREQGGWRTPIEQDRLRHPSSDPLSRVRAKITPGYRSAA